MINYRMVLQATTSNTSVVLIDPATGIPTVTPNVVTIPGQSVYTFNPATGDLTFDPFDGFTTDPTLSVISLRKYWQDWQTTL